MLKQLERESRDVSDLFYEVGDRRIYKINEALVDVVLAKSEESTLDNLLSVIEKAARIRADKKGGYAYKSNRESGSNRIM